jgi:hypothetical protein
MGHSQPAPTPSGVGGPPKLLQLIEDHPFIFTFLLFVLALLGWGLFLWKVLQPR